MSLNPSGKYFFLIYADEVGEQDNVNNVLV